MREAEISRNTKETQIKLKLVLDNKPDNKYAEDESVGKSGNSVNIATGCGFMNHMLELFAGHGGFGLTVECHGDTEVDYHHTVEDLGICLGLALGRALGDKRGIRRYGDIILPMDETLMLAAVDISGRAYLGYDVEMYAEKVGDFDTELAEEFMQALVRSAGLTLHFKKLAGHNTHHIIEAMFKALGRVLRQAVEIDPAAADRVPSTKGVI